MLVDTFIWIGRVKQNNEGMLESLLIFSMAMSDFFAESDGLKYHENIFSNFTLCNSQQSVSGHDTLLSLTWIIFSTVSLSLSHDLVNFVLEIQMY